MGRDDSLIMVVKTSDLFKDKSFQGFLSHNIIDYESIILKNYGFITRKFAENDPNYKQPIAYSSIVNPDTKQIFVFQRSKKDKAYGEKRLQGKFSWGIGGHIEKSDFKDSNPIRGSMLRELHEEVYIDGTRMSLILGYVNDDKDDVGKVHFGILYLVETNAKEVKPKDPEIDNGRFRTISELEDMCASKDFDIENWSRISLGPLKEFIS